MRLSKTNVVSEQTHMLPKLLQNIVSDQTRFPTFDVNAHVAHPSEVVQVSPRVTFFLMTQIRAA